MFSRDPCSSEFLVVLMFSRDPRRSESLVVLLLRPSLSAMSSSTLHSSRRRFSLRHFSFERRVGCCLPPEGEDREIDGEKDGERARESTLQGQTTCLSVRAG